VRQLDRHAMATGHRGHRFIRFDTQHLESSLDQGTCHLARAAPDVEDVARPERRQVVQKAPCSPRNGMRRWCHPGTNVPLDLVSTCGTIGHMPIETMSCPVCSSQALVLGVIVGRSPGVKFKEERGLLGDLSGTLITSGAFNHSAEAWRCEACGTVIVPGPR
jgi:hypothetical protein